MLEGDLARALELAPEALCSELGRGSCTRDVHHIALGGADPLVVGLYKPLHDTLATTPIVVDRVVLSACVARVTADRTADRTADPVVFAALDLEASAPAAESAAYRQTVTSLYRRFLSRDPDPGEFEVLADLLVDDGGSPVSSRDFAVLACYAVGTTTEFLFF